MVILARKGAILHHIYYFYPLATLLKIDAFSQGIFSNVAIILVCHKYVVILQANNFLVLTIMIITLCILILVYLIKGKPVDESLKYLGVSCGQQFLVSASVSFLSHNFH